MGSSGPFDSMLAEHRERLIDSVARGLEAVEVHGASIDAGDLPEGELLVIRGGAGDDATAAVAALRALAEGGRRAIAVLHGASAIATPSGERTPMTAAAVRAALANGTDVVVMAQSLAAASVFEGGSGGPPPNDSAEDEPEAVLVLVGLADALRRAEEEELLAPSIADTSPSVAGLARENAALRAANAKLMRDRLGASDTAAASSLAKAGEPASAGAGALVARVALAPLRRLRLLLRRAFVWLMR
jgi:hypothetical protein